MVGRPATSVRLLVDLGVERGHDRDALLAAGGLRAAALERPDAEVTADAELGVLAALVAGSSTDPVALGWEAGRRYHLTTYGIWGFALVSSPTVRAAVEVGSRHLALTYALARIAVGIDAQAVRIRLDGSHLPAAVRDAAVARDAAAVAAVRDELVGRSWPFTAVRSSAPAPADPTLGEAVFGTRVLHGADVDELVLPADALDRPLPRADARTAALAESQCAALLAERTARDGVSEAVRRRLLVDPSAPPSLEEVAHERGVTARTLRRQLRDEGTGWRALHDEVRSTLAHQLLVVAGLGVEATASRLGYAEPASFVHAFRRWTGTTPGRYRDRARKSPSGEGILAVRDPQS